MTATKQQRIAVLASFFALCLVGVFVVFLNFPELSDEDRTHLKWPRDVDQLREVHELISKYKDDNYVVVMTGFCTLYLFLQAFAIPGPIVLSLLAGALFGPLVGLAVVSLVATIGASVCYLFSFYLGTELIERWFPAAVPKFRAKVDQHRDSIFFYLLFLRLTPIVPNISINVASPILEISLWHFFWATLLGLIPLNYLHITTGMTLSSLRSFHDALSPKTLAFLFALGVLALIPTLFKDKLEALADGKAATGKAKAPKPRGGRKAPRSPAVGDQSAEFEEGEELLSHRRAIH